MSILLRDGHLLEARRQRQLVAKILLETPDRDHPSKLATRRMDPESVRGIPVLGRDGPGAAIPGTNPEREAMRKAGREEARRKRLEE